MDRSQTQGRAPDLRWDEIVVVVGAAAGAVLLLAVAAGASPWLAGVSAAGMAVVVWRLLRWRPAPDGRRRGAPFTPSQRVVWPDGAQYGRRQMLESMVQLAASGTGSAGMTAERLGQRIRDVGVTVDDGELAEIIAAMCAVGRLSRHDGRYRAARPGRPMFGP